MMATLTYKVRRGGSGPQSRLRRFKPKVRAKHRRRKLRLYVKHLHELSIAQKVQRDKSYRVLAMMRAGDSYTLCCKNSKIDPRTVRKHISIALYKKNNRIKPKKHDHLLRNMRTNELGKDVFVELSDSREATRLAQYHDAVRAYLQNGELGPLNGYNGQGVVDSSGDFHAFETNPKVLVAMYERIEQPEFYSVYETT